MYRLDQGLLALSWLATLVSAQKLTSTPANFRGFQLYPNGAGGCYNIEIFLPVTYTKF